MPCSADDRAALAARIADTESQIAIFRGNQQDTSAPEAALAYLKAQSACQDADLPAAQAHYRAAVAGFRQTGMGAEQAVVAIEAARAMQAAGLLAPALEFAGAALDGAELIWLGMSAADRLHAPRELIEAGDAALPIAFAAADHVQMFEIIQRCKACWFNEQLMMREIEQLPFVQSLAGPGLSAVALGNAFKALDEAWNRLLSNNPPDALPDARPQAEAALLAAYTAETARRRPLRPLQAVTAGIETCRLALQPGEGLLEFFVCTNEVFAVLLTADRLHIEPLGIGAVALRDRILRMSTALQSTPDGGDFAASARQSDSPERRQMLEATGAILYPAPAKLLAALGALLLGPLETALTGLRRLIVCPHWWLHAVPFHALGTRGGGMLAAAVAVTYAPSASCWIRMRRLASPANAAGAPQVAVLGVERQRKPEANWFDDQAAQAPPAPPSLFEVEAQAVALVSGTVPVLGEAATKQAFAAALKTADIVHVSCHNVLDRPNALTDGLVLSNGVVTVAELSAAPRTARRGPLLVALSACQSGIARVEPGDLRISPGDALAARYGCSVISSLWPVDAEATAMLMRRLYFHHAELGDWAAALRCAQHDTQAAASETKPAGPAGPDFSDPYYWAGFFIFGP